VSTEVLLAQAKRRLHVADHFLTQTYPLMQDPKLLVSALEGLVKSVEEAVDAMLLFEREQGRIPAYHEGNFAAKLALIRGDVAKRYNFGHIDLAMIEEMHGLLKAHKDSAMEFSRHGKYIMAQHDFQLQTISVEKIKTYLARAKTLYTKIHDVIISPRRN
jgi:hypothetical protein